MKIKKLMFFVMGMLIVVSSQVQALVKVKNDIWYPVKFEYYHVDLPRPTNCRWQWVFFYVCDWITTNSRVIIVNPGEEQKNESEGLMVKTRFVVSTPKYPDWVYTKVTNLMTEAQTARDAGDSVKADNLESEAKNISLNPDFQKEWVTQYDQPLNATNAEGAGNRYVRVTMSQSNLAKAMRGELDLNVSNSFIAW